MAFRQMESVRVRRRRAAHRRLARRRVKPGTRTDAMVQWTDFLPTLLEAAGGKRLPPTLMAAPSCPCCAARPPPPRAGLHHAQQRQPLQRLSRRAVRDERWKYIRNLHPEFAFTTHIDLVAGRLGQRAFFSTWEAAAKTDPQAAAILKRYHARPAEELYDLACDPHEQSNLAGEPQPRRTTRRVARRARRLDEGAGRSAATVPEPRLLSDPSSYGPKAEIADQQETGRKEERPRNELHLFPAGRRLRPLRVRWERVRRCRTTQHHRHPRR